MLKLARRARGHFVTLIEIRVHLIRVKPGHIKIVDTLHLLGAISMYLLTLHTAAPLSPLSVLLARQTIAENLNSQH